MKNMQYSLVDKIEIAASEQKWSDVVELAREGVSSACDPDLASILLVRLSGYGNAEIVQWLLDGGANPNYRDQAGTTPLLATCEVDSVGNEEIIQLLIENGADPNAHARGGRTPLQWAVAWKLLPQIELLLEMGGDPEILTDDPDDQVDSFTVARRTGNREIVALLSQWQTVNSSANGPRDPR